MKNRQEKEYRIRSAWPEEYEALGRMTARVYQRLPDMPGPVEQPQYYEMLKDVAGRASRPTIEILVAVTPGNELLGGVTFVGDMKYYASGGAAPQSLHSSGVRLLAVRPGARRFGVGKALTMECIHRAVLRGSAHVILHTTKSMEIAWGMYERMGFVRSPDLDFKQEHLPVYGFRLAIDSKSGEKHGCHRSVLKQLLVDRGARVAE